MILLTYANHVWGCTSWIHCKHLCSPRSVWVFKRCSESVWKVHKRHACSTQKVSSRYQAVNHLRDYFSWITSRRQAQFLADLYLSWSTMPRFVLTTHMTERAVAQWLALWCWSSESEATVGSTPDRESVKDRFQFFWDTVCTNTVALVS